MVRPDFNQTVYHKASLAQRDSNTEDYQNLAQQKSQDIDDTGDRWAHWWQTYGHDPDPFYHDVHFMTRPDFNQSTL